MARIAFLVLVLCIAGCQATTTSEFVSKQVGFQELVTGYPISVTIDTPVVTKLKDGVAYTTTNDKSKVLLEFDERASGMRGKKRRSYDLKKGDIFIKSGQTAYIMIKAR